MSQYLIVRLKVEERGRVMMAAVRKMVADPISQKAVGAEAEDLLEPHDIANLLAAGHRVHVGRRDTRTLQWAPWDEVRLTGHPPDLESFDEKGRHTNSLRSLLRLT
jgi:hypothetical protein